MYESEKRTMLRSTYGVVAEFVLDKPKGLSRCHLLGRAGTGKSYAIRQLSDAAQRQGQRVKRCAFTNEIADQLEGSTIHKTFGLGVSPSGSFLRKGNFLQDVDLIFLDEYTLVGLKDWSLICKRLAQSSTRLVLVGDPYQLPPVKGKPRIIMEPKDTFELTTQYRNPEMAQLIEWFVWHIENEVEIEPSELFQICPYGKLDSFIGSDGSKFIGNYPVILGYTNNLFHQIDQSHDALPKELWCLCTPLRGLANIGDTIPRSYSHFGENQVIPDWSRTVHKAQGKTYTGSPLVMLDNILQAPRNLRSRLLYVACTRGTELPTLCTDPYTKPKRRRSF